MAGLYCVLESVHFKPGKDESFHFLLSLSLCLLTLQEKDDGTGDLLIKQAHKDKATVQATDDYAQRVSIDDKFSLLIDQATLKDQKTFTCMVVSGVNLMEYPVTVVVHSKFHTESISLSDYVYRTCCHTCRKHTYSYLSKCVKYGCVF